MSRLTINTSKVGDRIFLIGGALPLQDLTFGLLFGIRQPSSYSMPLPIQADLLAYPFHAIDRQGFDPHEYTH